MQLHRRWTLTGLLVVAVVILVVPGEGQVPGGGIGPAALDILDEIDLLCLRAILGDSGFRAEVEGALEKGPCSTLRHSRFVLPSGDRVYHGTLRFGRGFGLGEEIRFAYFHDASAGKLPPSLPPDQIAYAALTDTRGSSAGVVIQDATAYAFLLHVIDEWPVEIVDPLHSSPLRALQSLHIPAAGGSSELVQLTLVYGGADSADLIWVTCTAEYDGSSFGPLNFD